MSTANAFEAQMLTLINQERQDAGLNALVFNPNLNVSSELHSAWMLQADVFSHTGQGGSSAHARMQAAGYPFEGSWSSGENIAYQSLRGAPGLEDDVVDLHNALMNSPGHRANILNTNFTEIGIGIERGDFTSGNGTFDALMVTQNFARSDGSTPGTPPPPPPPPAEDALAFPDEAFAFVLEGREPDEAGIEALNGWFDAVWTAGGDSALNEAVELWTTLVTELEAAQAQADLML